MKIGGKLKLLFVLVSRECDLGSKVNTGHNSDCEKLITRNMHHDGLVLQYYVCYPILATAIAIKAEVSG